MNVLKSDKINTIITLSNNGVSQRKISKRTAINRKTIRRYLLQSDQAPHVDLKSKYPSPATGSEGEIVDHSSPLSSSENESKMVHKAKSACDPHREWIEKQVGLGRNGVSIYQDY